MGPEDCNACMYAKRCLLWRSYQHALNGEQVASFCKFFETQDMVVAKLQQMAKSVDARALNEVPKSPY